MFLFLVVGGLKHRWGDDDLGTARSPLREQAPVTGLLLLTGLAAGLGLPGLAGFWGEIVAVVAALSPADGRPVPLFVGCAVVAAVVTSVLWAAAYGTDDLTGFLGRLALGLAASAAVASTGGVEAAIALHVVVAVVVLVLGAVLGEDAVPGLVPGGPGEAFALVGALGVAAFAVAAARRGART